MHSANRYMGCSGIIMMVLFLLTLSACSLTPPDEVQVTGDGYLGVARTAQGLVGTPYRYGGATPRGFDCSGLVYYAYGQAGMRVPRSTEAQYAATSRVRAGEAVPGDVLFFRIEGKPSHVGIYLGNGRFVHAPSSGKQVTYASLDDDYWNARLVKIGRF